MPTVLMVEGFEVVIYPDDHVPPHVRVRKAGAEVKIDLNPVMVRRRKGMSDRDAAKARRIVTQYRDMLRSEWGKIHDEGEA